MNFFNDDLAVLFVNIISVCISIALLHFGKSNCVVKNIAYGIAFLPISYLLVLPMGLGGVFIIFGVFYIPYMFAITIPSIITEKLGIKYVIMNNFTDFSKPLEYLIYVVFWIMIFYVATHFSCNKN